MFDQPGAAAANGGADCLELIAESSPIVASLDKGVSKALSQGGGHEFEKIQKDYLRKKEVFDRLEMVYEKMMKPGTSVWAGERLHEHYDTNFTDRAAFLMDVAREDIIITAYRLYSDFILLDALKRAVARGVKIRIIAEEIDASVSEKLRKIGVEMRLGRAWPYVVIADANHGITVDSDGKGLWFLNYNTDYRRRFDEMWDKAEEV